MAMKTYKFFDALTSPFRHNLTTTIFILFLIFIAVFSFLSRADFLFTAREALNILVFLGFGGIALKAYQLFKKRKV